MKIGKKCGFSFNRQIWTYLILFYSEFIWYSSVIKLCSWQLFSNFDKNVDFLINPISGFLFERNLSYTSLLNISITILNPKVKNLQN